MNDQEIMAWIKENTPPSCDSAWQIFRGKVSRDRFRKLWNQYHNKPSRESVEEWVGKQKDFIAGRELKILNLDGEISPSVTLSFNFFKTSPFMILTARKIISLSCSFSGEKKIWGKSIFDYPEYTPPPHIEGLDEKVYLAIAIGLIDRAEKELLREFLEIYEQADMVVGHNLKKFDVKFIHARALYHGLETVEPKHAEDTLEILRRYFNLERNTLDYACEYFGIPTKSEEKYAGLIDGCLLGNKDNWKKLKVYNNQDVYIDDLLYNKIKPYHKTHFNLNLISRKKLCPVCQSDNFVPYKVKPLKTQIKQKYRCVSCGHSWVGETIAKASKQEPVLLETERID